jgi:hypothetical protein
MGLFEKAFSFSEKSNIIYSKANSVGKTTLMRVLLYSLGYNVPGTKRFPIEKYEYEVSVTLDDGTGLILRRPTAEIIESRTGETVCSFFLPNQMNRVHALLFNTGNIDILNNILGTFYLDQEKGWTLLNRGRVIGSIHFNIEDFIQGLSGIDCSELKKQKDLLEQEIAKYEQISNVTKYKETLEASEGSLLKESHDDEIETQIKLKQIELNHIRRELSRIDRVMNSNKQFKNLVEEMKLMVETPQGEAIRVTSDNIIGLNDSIDYLIAKRKIIAVEYNGLIRAVNKLRAKKTPKDDSMFMVKSIADAFDEMVQKFPYGYVKIEEIKEKLKRQLLEIRQQISEKTRSNNKVVGSLYANVIRYADELGVRDESLTNLNYLFTTNMKILSGALLHKTVFSFRLAYILEVKRLLGSKLPIILDSPSGKEIDSDNIRLMINILKRDFSDHQIIIASIYEYDLPEVNKIELKKSLMEGI